MTEAQGERLIAAVERLCAVVELALTPDPPPVADPTCVHPSEQRIDFGVTDGRPDWQCGVCGYRPSLAEEDVTICP